MTLAVYARPARAKAKGEAFSHKAIDTLGGPCAVCSVNVEDGQFVYTEVDDWSSPGFYALAHTLNVWQRHASGNASTVSLIQVELNKQSPKKEEVPANV